MKASILVVDDTPENLQLLMGILAEHGYDVRVAPDGELALKFVRTTLPDLILLDIKMPGMDGYQVCKQLKADTPTCDIPIIFLSALDDVFDKVKAFSVGGVDYVTKPFVAEEVVARVQTHLTLKFTKEALKNQNVILEEKVRERTQELALTQEVTIQTLASLAETRDNETGGHIRRTQNYVKILAEQLKTHEKFCNFLDNSTIELLFRSAPLHDIGKVGVPDRILLKPGKLTDEEFEEMKKHVIYGYNAFLKAGEYFQGTSFLHFAREIASTHHEKWDGSGYLQGLKDEEIPISGRIMALADVYDALISKRVYKHPFPHTKAVVIIIEGKGKHFDPDIVDAFLELEEEFRQIALRYADYEEERKALCE
ncbi:MAG: two-component system response regulator [Anaerolineales bacterium]|nr:two-component system response regulator [Anaerolineales bacterium]